MTETKEPKVTECSIEGTSSDPASPSVTSVAPLTFIDRYSAAILVRREDYDAMRRELKELREYRNGNELHRKMTAEAEAKEREHRKQLAVCKTWEQG